MAGDPQAADPPSASSEAKLGTELLHDELLNQNVEVMFGYGGGAIMPMFDQLYEGQATIHDLLHILEPLGFVYAGNLDQQGNPFRRLLCGRTCCS